MELHELKRIYKQDGSGRAHALGGYRQILCAHPGGVPKPLGHALLALAADFAHPEALSLLLEAGCDPAVESSMNHTLLHILAQKKESHYYKKPDGAVAQCVNLLLARRVSPLKKDLDGKPCYHHAAAGGMHAFIEALAAQGKRTDMTDRQGNTGIHIAAKEAGGAVYAITRGKEKVEKAKADYIKIADQQKRRGKSDAEITEYIAKNMDGLTPDANRERSELAQAEAQLEHYFLTVRAFIQGGADPEEKNSSGHTALDYAVESGAKKIAAYLSGALDEGGDGAIAAGGMTLHQAAEKGDAQAINALAATGLDLNLLQDDVRHPFGGCTPLAIACAYLQADAAGALLASGADPSFKDGSGRTAVDYLVNNLRVPACARIFEGGLIPQLLNNLVSAGMHINETVNDDADTLLISACKSVRGTGFNRRSVKGEIIAAVLAHSPDIRCTNRRGETALMHACAKDFDLMEQVQITLLEQGADVTQADENGDTALHYAARNQDGNGAKTLCSLLLEFGADANAVNNAGQTALELASELNYEPLVKLLLRNM